MEAVDVAVVSRDPEMKLLVAQAFDGAPAHWNVRLCEDRPEHADVIVHTPDIEAQQDDIAFDPLLAEGLVPEIERVLSSRAVGRVLVCTSSCGGSGVTNLALHVARAAAASAQVCYIDLAGGAADRIGLAPEAMTWLDVGETAESLRLAALPVPGAFRALLAPRAWETSGAVGGDADVAVQFDAARLIARAVTQFERVIVDVRPGPHLACTLTCARCAVVVTPATRTGAVRTATFLDSLPDIACAVVAVRTGAGGETTTNGLRRIIGRKIAMELPSTAALRDAEDDARLLTSCWSRYARGIRRLARALERV